MNISKRTGAIIVASVLGVGVLLGIVFSGSLSKNALADDDDYKVDRQVLGELYQAVFGRPLDDGASFHLGKNLKTVLRDINNSDERRYYSALFLAVKAYEEAVRAPGSLTTEEKAQYLEAIDSALATLVAWVESLPEQNPCSAVVGPERAREAIMTAYNRLNDKGKDSAEHGLMNAYSHKKPHELKFPLRKCVTPIPVSSVSSTPTPTPTPTPTSTPTPSPTAEPSPTPTPTPSPTVEPSPTPTPTV